MHSPLSAYQKNQIQTLSQEKLVLMLYDGAKKFLTKSIKALEEKNIQDSNNYLQRSQNIMAELMSGINHDAGEIAGNFYNLYEYMHYRLMQANLKKEKEPVEEVLTMVSELRDTWMRMLKENNAQKAGYIQERSIGIGI